MHLVKWFSPFLFTVDQEKFNCQKFEKIQKNYRERNGQA